MTEIVKEIEDPATLPPAKAKEEELGEPVPKGGKRLSKAEWEEITNVWELGTVKLRELQDKYGISKSAFSQYFTRHGKFYGSRKGEVGASVSAAVKSAAAAAAVETFESKRMARIESYKEEAFVKTKWISQLSFKILNDAVKSGTPGGAATAKEALRAVLLASKIHNQTLGDLAKILGVDETVNSDDLPIIIFKDMSAEEIENAHKRDEDDLDLEDLSEDEPEDGVVKETEE